jgi:transcriptional regulator with XRE-family HTH domain
LRPVKQCREAELLAATVKKQLKTLFRGSNKRGSGRNAFRLAALIERLARKGQRATVEDAVSIVGYIEILVSMLSDEMDQILVHPGRQTFGLRFPFIGVPGVFPVKSTIGKTIRIIRTAKGKSLRDLAADSKLSVPYLSLVESGKRQPSLSALQEIGKALKVPTEVLLMLGLGSESNLSSSDPRTTDITNSIEKLIGMEKRLKDILANTEAAHESD